ncbi:hypothetical protein, partial [Corynebacterium sp.]|uniref:hypothetical protein n=1 Tax=Corynebacterium sp. TaxID=1720 RepID=UPI0028B0DDA2
EALSDAIREYVSPALADEADSYDLDAIAAEAFTYRTEPRQDADGPGWDNDSTAGFYLSVSADKFWEIVAKHEKSPGA